jgi:hypothetical protein
MDKKQIEKEIIKTKSEIAMQNANDGWWHNYMVDKLERLKKILKNDNNRDIDKKN